MDIAVVQTGVIKDPNTFAEYLTFTLNHVEANASELIGDILSQLDMVVRSIRQKAPECDLSQTIAFSSDAWPILFPDMPKPEELHEFPALTDGPRNFPSTSGDIFVMIKSERMDLIINCI